MEGGVSLVGQLLNKSARSPLLENLPARYLYNGLSRGRFEGTTAGGGNIT